MEVGVTMVEFFMPMKPPEKTFQDKIVRVAGKKAVIHDSDELKAVKQKLIAHLGPHAPDVPYTGPIRLINKWLYMADDKHPPGWKITKPDTDNMVKTLKDCMTKVGFWPRDELVASEITEKVYSLPPHVGIYIKIEEL